MDECFRSSSHHKLFFCGRSFYSLWNEPKNDLMFAVVSHDEL